MKLSTPPSIRIHGGPSIHPQGDLLIHRSPELKIKKEEKHVISRNDSA